MGAFISVILIPVVSVFSSIYWFPKKAQIWKRLNFSEFDSKIFKNLISFSLMILPTTILSPYFYLQIRNYLIATVGLNESGFWEGMTRISTLYLMFVSTIVSVYFYPKLIKSNGVAEVNKVIWSYYKFILPVFIIGALFVYFLRFLIIEILFTTEFLPVSELFFWQLIGDVFKVCGMVLGFLLMAQKRILHFVIVEVSAILFLYLASIFCIKNYGLEGVVIGQAIENVVYFLGLGIYFRKYLL
jgi:PST family polysaccharide transporter